MIVHVRSRKTVEQAILHSCDSLTDVENFYRLAYHISIWGDGMDPLHCSHKHLIQLNFDDITEKEKVMNTETRFEDLILFNEHHAIVIIAFLKLIKGENCTDLPLIINCKAGISRSGAVGKFANLYLNQDNLTDYEANDKVLFQTTMPNNYIFSKLVRVAEEKFGDALYGQSTHPI